ncbi:hypothetical protein O181_004860 [Austropuccinia psidii MF-1]|uniref:Uncharacterized protein n=1 Tax=Austropuccinia psidii MF-1 TaxID=1389203 RepID=A0A9Q3GF97_9BASI|nr:hypothetical protein [Austropuccinia psidii MF-1]
MSTTPCNLSEPVAGTQAFSFINKPLDYISWIPKLRSDGTNFLEWRRELDIFLMFTFDLSNFTKNYFELHLPSQVNKAVRYLIQKTIDPQLLSLIEQCGCAKDAILILQSHFHHSIRNHQLKLFLRLMETHHTSRSKTKDVSAAPIPQFFQLLNELRQTGLNVPQDVQSLLIQTLIPPPPSHTQAEWFEVITSHLNCCSSYGPKDVHKAIYKFFQPKTQNVSKARSIKQENQQLDHSSSCNIASLSE